MANGSVPMTGHLDMGSHQIHNLAAPSASTDAATMGTFEAFVIKEPATGEVISVSDSADYRLLGLKLYGKSVQDGVPTPEAPVEIESAGNEGSITVNITGENICPVSNGKWAILLSTHVTAGVTYTLCAKATDPNSNLGFNLQIRGTNNNQGALLQEIKNKNISSGHVTFTPQVSGWMYINCHTADQTWADIAVYVGTVNEYKYIPYSGQSLTYPTPNGLPGIPVESGGNYTDADGQEWVCDEVDFGAGKKTQRIGVINSYNSESVGEVYMSSTGQLTAGAKVLYPLTEPVETDLTPEQLAAYAALTTYKPNTTVTTDSSPAAGVSVDYVADTKTYIDNKIASISEAIMGGNT